MKRFIPWPTAVSCLLLVALALGGVDSRVVAADATAALPATTALDDYLARPDPSYAWNIVQISQRAGCTQYLVDLTSQTWRTPQEVDRPLWKHWLLVYKPDHVSYDTALLFVSHGANDDRQPDPAKGMVADLATATQSVVAELMMVPNQPLVFMRDGQKRTEDDLIGYTWDKVMTTGDPTWSARFPMVKSTLRAMDTVQKLMASQQGGKVRIEKFVVAGGSKRGWVTWLTGAVDPRVVAIIPIVIDVINFDTSFRHQYAAYGFWPPAIHDYVDHKIVNRLGTPEAGLLFSVEDPYYYRHRLKIPKYIITASGDQYFPPDSSRFYFDDLQGEKYLRAVPNTRHSLDGTDALESVTAFYQQILDGKPRPRFAWQFASDGAVEIQCKDQPAKVTLWQATNPDARDFRLEKIGPQYRPTGLNGSNGKYEARVEKPAKGWTAWFVELTYPTGKFPLKFTTPVRVIPDVYPFQEHIIPGTAIKAGQ